MSKIKMDQTFINEDGEVVGTVTQLTPVKEASLEKGIPEAILDEKTGNPLAVRFEDKSKALTLRQVIVKDVNMRGVDEKGKQEEWNEDKSWNAYCIQKKVFEAPKSGIELESSEIVLILAQVNKFRSTWIYGQVRGMLK